MSWSAAGSPSSMDRIDRRRWPAPRLAWRAGPVRESSVGAGCFAGVVVRVSSSSGRACWGDASVSMGMGELTFSGANGGGRVEWGRVVACA